MGEWSAASTDCALWLNGRGVGSRWDGTLQGDPTTQVHGLCDGLTGSLATFSNDYKTFLRKFVLLFVLSFRLLFHIPLLGTGKFNQ